MSSNNPVESRTEIKSANDTNHDGQAVHDKFADDIKGGAPDVARLHAPSTAKLPDLKIIDSGVESGIGINTAGEALNIGKNVLHTAENEWSNLKAGIGGVEKIVPQMVKGAVQEVEQHPLQIAGDALLGAGAAMGMSALAPELVIGAGFAAAGYEAVKLYNKASDWENDARVDCNPTKFSQQDINAANKDLQSTGASTADMLAAGIGGFGGFAYMGLTDASVSSAFNTGHSEYAEAGDYPVTGMVGYITAGLQHIMGRKPEVKPEVKQGE
jgi:hypothetical protein